MSRDQTIKALQAKSHFDLIVIGGGSTGLGTALDAATRGLSVALFDSHDFAGGTSSRSTKLLHGGVRYLAQGNIKLVREALTERQTVMKLAPHLAQPLAFVMPTYKWWQKIWFGLGLKVYEFLAGKFSLGKTKLLDHEATTEAIPGVKGVGLRGGVQYWDGQFDDSRLAISIALTAEKHGAYLLNYANVETLTPHKPGGYQIEIGNKLSDQVLSFSADCVINAAGVWVDDLIKKSKPSGNSHDSIVAPSQGVHLVVNREFLQGDQALLIPKTEDGRVLFAVPWLGSLILGTTDTARDDMPREPKPFEEEIAFILNEASKALSRNVTEQDVKSVWVGLRPLVKNESEGSSTKSISREHTILIDPSGLITVTGGKWTTYRAMAEEVVDKAIDNKLVKSSLPCQTAHVPLVGCETKSTKLVSLTQSPNIHLFGAKADLVNTLKGTENRLGLGLTEAMVRYCVRHEHAIFVEDVLARRWRALFLDAKMASEMAPRVAEIIREETGIDPKLSNFLALCEQYQLHPQSIS